MIKNENIRTIIEKSKGEGYDVDEKDIAYIIILDKVEDNKTAYKMIYGSLPRKFNAEKYNSTDKITFLKEMMKSFGIGNFNGMNISKEENKAKLLKTYNEIEEAKVNGELELDKALKMQTDICVKLNDKFDIEEDDDSGNNIIVVPSKHDIICPYTHRECTYMPTKAACMQYYNLK